MRAFEVFLNGQQVCIAGVGERGVLSTSVTWVVRASKPGKSRRSGLCKEELGLEVGGLDSTHEHLNWPGRKLQVGDAVLIKVVETDAIDKPSSRKRYDPAEEQLAKMRYVEHYADELGWKILKPE